MTPLSEQDRQREKFLEQAEELGNICEKLPPGTGKGIELIIDSAYGEGFAAGQALCADAYAAGRAEGVAAMKEKAAMVADQWSCSNAKEWARYKMDVVNSIRALKEGE